MVTARMRERVAELADTRPVLADSRARIGLFRNVCLKPNQHECLDAVPGASLEGAAEALAKRNGRTVFCTRGEAGILLAEPLREVPGYPVAGPIDPVGAGDSTSAGIICALAAGATAEQAAAFGNLVASITVQQLGTTGTATPDQVRARLAEVGGRDENRRVGAQLSVALSLPADESKVLSTAFEASQPQPNRVPARRDLQGP
ncbi:MAG: PfkB family carbohydrate kinase [Gemmataceae bacterium]